MQLDPLLGAAIAKLDRLQTKAVIQAIDAGVTPTEDSYQVLEYGTEEQKQRQAELYTDALKQKQALDAKVRAEQANLAKIQGAGKQIEKTEQKINDKYDKRIAQIEKIKKLNEQIARSQEGQLTLAEALNRGDVAAAARAAMDIQKNDVQDALENQKTGLDEARKAEISPLKQQTEDNTNAVNALTTKIQTLIDTGITVKDTGDAEKIITPKEFIDMMNAPDWLRPALDFIITKDFVDRLGGMFGIQTNANGGYIRGAGTGTSDDIPAMLSNGEYVIRANAVKTIGVDTLNKLNQADRLGFAAGGMVDKFKKKKPKPKPYTLDDLRKPISEKDDPEWYDYTYNFLKQQPGGFGPFRNYKYTRAESGFYKAKAPSDVSGQRDLVDYSGENLKFTSVAGTIKYYKALIAARRAGVEHIDAISQDRWWTGMGIPKEKVRQSNRIDNRTFGKYNGLDKIEARTLASAMTRLFGKDKVGEGFKALGLSTDLLTNKTMFNNNAEKLAYERYTKNNKKSYPILSPNAPKYAMGGMVRHFKGGGYNGYADGGFVGPRPAPQWDEKGRWVVSRGESYWSTAEETLPGGMTIGPWWSRILKSNIDPETGKERRLYRNSRIWIPGSKQPYPPKIGIPRTINEKKPLYMGGMPFRGIGENHLGFMGVGGFGIMKQYANGGLVGYKDGGKAKKSRGYPAAFNVTSGVGKGQAERNKLYKQGGFQGFEAGFNSWTQGIMNDPVSGTILKKVGEGIEANPLLNFALSTLSLPVNLIGGAVNASMNAGQALAKGDLFGAATAGLRGTGDAFASTYGNMFSKMIGDDAVYRPQFEVAAQTAYDMNLFNAQNDPEIAALGRIIGGAGDLAFDPLNYVGVGAAAKVAGKGVVNSIKTAKQANQNKKIESVFNETVKRMGQERGRDFTPEEIESMGILPTIQTEVLRQQGFNQVIKNPAIITRRSVDSVIDMLRTDKTKTLGDTGSSAGGNDIQLRRHLEHEYLGGDYQADNIIYGYLADKGLLKRPLIKPKKPVNFDGGTDFYTPFSLMTQHYGPVGIVMKNSSMGRATITKGDSLNAYLDGKRIQTIPFQGSKTKNPFDPLDAAQNPGRYPEYMEAQFLKYSPRRDIEALYVQNKQHLEKLRAVVKELGLNIPVRMYNKTPVVQDFLERVKNAKMEKIRQRQEQDAIDSFANGGMVKAAGGGLMINGQITGGYNMGGMVQKFANGGYAMGTDTVPAMLTPGEFVIKKSAVDRIGPSALNKINGYAEGGLVGGSSVAAVGDSVYNNNAYEINVNVRSDANPDQIARAVMTQIRQIDNHRIRGV
jgi:hypothetical protein